MLELIYKGQPRMSTAIIRKELLEYTPIDISKAPLGTQINRYIGSTSRNRKKARANYFSKVY